jgi:hypothetical protein
MDFSTKQKICGLNNALFEACSAMDKTAVTQLIEAKPNMVWNDVAALSAALFATNASHGDYKFVEFIVEKFPDLKFRIASGIYGEPHNSSCRLFKEIIEEENIDMC